VTTQRESLDRAVRHVVKRPLFAVAGSVIGTLSIAAIIAYWAAPDTAWLQPIVRVTIPTVVLSYFVAVYFVATRERRR
jgi:hypothetical protein